MSRRLRTETEIAAALGSALLGTVDVPGERRAHRPEGRGPRARIRRLLGVDVRWDTPAPQASGDEADRRIRYRRVCAHLRDRLPATRQVLVVVPDGDETALRAAGQLVAESGAGNESANGSGADPSASSPGSGYPVLRVVEVSVSRPLVPDRDGESGVVVVLSAGSWTAGELAGIAEACADARQEVVGIVLAGLVRARPARSAGPPPEAVVPAVSVGHDAAGGAA